MAEEHNTSGKYTVSPVIDNDNHIPTFNSNAIEMRLHHINGLSKNFLSFNDDFFIGRSCKKEDFFHDSNTPKIFTSKNLY